MLKFFLKYSVLAAIVCAVFTGCVEKLPVLILGNETPYMSFTPIHTETKALLNSQEDLQDSDGVGLFGTLSRTASQTIFSNDRLQYADDSWSYGYVLWWIKGGFYDFAAVYPYTDDEASIGSGKANYSYSPSGSTISISNISANWESPDLMYGFAERDLTTSENYSTVPINMNHAFASVEFRILNASGEAVRNISDISLKQIISSGSVSATSNNIKPDWTLGTRSNTGYTRSGVVFPTVEYNREEHSLFNGPVVVIPQQVLNAGTTLSFNKTGGDNQTSISVNLSNIGKIQNWEAGKKYSYLITLQSTTITYTVEVVDWIEDPIYNLN